MSQVAPFEIMAAPFSVYVADVGTAEPDISDAPSAWTLLGTNGTENYDEDGVTITHEQTVEEFRPAGSTGATKAFRTEESIVVSFNLVDISAAMYAEILNRATVTDTAAGSGAGGNLNFDLYQGFVVNTFALLVRGDQSADADAADSDHNTQYWIPKAYQNGNPEPVFKKGEPAMLACEFRALKDPSSGFGKFRAQDADATA